jgi:hypothetical protein
MMPNWPALLMVTCAPLIGTPAMPAMKVRVWALPSRMVLDSVVTPVLPR